MPEGAEHSFIWIYFAGCARMMEGDMEGAFAQFDAFRSTIGGFVSSIGVRDFIEHHPLNLILRQGRLAAGPDEVARRIEAFLDATPRRGPALTSRLKLQTSAHRSSSPAATGFIFPP